MSREERIRMINAIYIELTTGPGKLWSLGKMWLKKMTDEELQAKHEEVFGR